jgi:hypothetical protein
MSDRITFWGFPIDPGLHESARQTIERIQGQRPSRSNISEEAASVVTQLTEAGLQHYYRVPVQQVGMPPQVKRFADSGVRVVMSAINMVIRQFFKNRSSDEMLEMAAYLEPMLWWHPEKSRPYLVFVLDSSLHERAIVLIGQVRTDQNSRNYIDEVVDTLCELVEQGVIHYYQSPSDKVGLQGLTRKTVDLGMRNAQKGIRMLIDKLVRDLPHQHLVELSFHIESMIHPIQPEK